MNESRVVRVPDFSELVFSEKQKKLWVKDEQIFYDLNMKHRSIEDKVEGACEGDYVLCEIVRTDGKRLKRQIEMGAGHFPEYEKALSGSCTGQTISAQVNGKSNSITILSVRRVVNLPLTDEAIAGLKLPEVTSLIEYRKMYLMEHGDEIAEKFFKALRKKLLSQLLLLTDFELEESEIKLYNERQLRMLANISGDVDERLMKAFGENEKKSLQECYESFYEENKNSFKLQLLGKALALKNQVEPDEKARRMAMEFYCLAFDTTEEEVVRNGLIEESLRSFYMQYGIDRLKCYYKSQVRFYAEGIEEFPLQM